MRKIGLFLTLAALPALAQWRHFSDPDIRLAGFFGAGVSAPVNPIATRLKTGWNLAGGVGATGHYIGVTVDGMYNDFGLNHNALVRDGARSGHQRYWAVTVDPVVHTNPRGPVDFYLTGGLGVYGQLTSLRSASGVGQYDLLYSNNVTKPGANLGAGFSFNLGSERDPKIFVEARYHHLFMHGTSASLIPVTMGVRF